MRVYEGGWSGRTAPVAGARAMTSSLGGPVAERPARESRPGVLGAGIIQLLIRNPASGYD